MRRRQEIWIPYGPLLIHSKGKLLFQCFHCHCLVLCPIFVDVVVRNERLEKGLDSPVWMQRVRVNLLNTEMSWSTRVAIADRKQAVDLDISSVPPSEAADNFLMHICEMPRHPNESDLEYIKGVIPSATLGSA